MFASANVYRSTSTPLTYRIRSVLTGFVESCTVTVRLLPYDPSLLAVSVTATAGVVLESVFDAFRPAAPTIRNASTCPAPPRPSRPSPRNACLTALNPAVVSDGPKYDLKSARLRSATTDSDGPQSCVKPRATTDPMPTGTVV